MVRNFSLFAICALCFSCNNNNDLVTELQNENRILKTKVDSLTQVALIQKQLADLAKQEALQALFVADSAKAVALRQKMRYEKLKNEK